MKKFLSLVGILLFSTGLYSEKITKTKTMKWSLGRLDFSLPEQFELKGRNQSIFHIEVATIPLEKVSAKEIWNQRIEQLRVQHVSNGFPLDTFTINEIAPDFSIVFYQENKSLHLLVTAEAYKEVGDNILTLKYSGQKGKEDVMREMISLTAADYRPDITNGFNVGAGSLISPPSINEHASATFEDRETRMKLTLYIHTSGPTPSKGPLDSIDDEIKGLGAEGIQLRVIQQVTRKAAGFSGEQGLVEIKSPAQNESGFRYTWFYAGETANGFKPEIRIQLNAKPENQESATMIWEKSLDSMKMRSLK